MKILYVTLENLSLHKGSVIHIKEIVNGLRYQGHEVGLVARSSNPYEDTESFYCLCLAPERGGGTLRSHFISAILLFLRLFKILKGYDIVYARDYHATILAFLPCFLFSKKLIFEINGLANEEQRLKKDSFLNRALVVFIRKAEKAAAKAADRIVCVTPQIARYLRQDLHCEQDKIEIVGNGVNTGKFHPIRDEVSLSAYRERIGIKPREKVLVFVGNLARWQGIETLIDCSVDLLTKQNRLKFLIVGDGPLRADLLEKARDAGVENSFIFTGMVDYEEVPFYINLGDIGVAPFISKRNTRTGVSPLKVFEYMACGKPVVASRIEGLEFVEHEGIGRLIAPGAVQGFAEALNDLLQNDGKRTEMGEKASRIAFEEFSWASKAEKIQSILQKMA